MIVSCVSLCVRFSAFIFYLLIKFYPFSDSIAILYINFISKKSLTFFFFFVVFCSRLTHWFVSSHMTTVSFLSYL